MDLTEYERRVYIGHLQAVLKYKNKRENVETSIPFSDLNLPLETIFSFWNADYLSDFDKKDSDNENQESVSNESEENSLTITGRTNPNTPSTTHPRLLSPRDVRIDTNKRNVVILFDAIDPHGADVTYKNYKTRESRRNRKTEYEGINYSAHLVIKYDGTNGLYDAAFEYVPYLSISVINQILSKMVNSIRKHNPELFTIPSPTGNPDMFGNIINEPCRLQLSFHPVPDQRFWEIVSHRDAVTTLELVNTNPQNDNNTPLSIKKKSVVFDLPSQDFFDNVKTNLISVFSYGRDNSFDALKVTIKTNTGNTKTVWFNTTAESPIYENFSRMELIEGLQEKMATATDVINDELVERMGRLLS